MEHIRVSIIEKTAKEQTQALLNKEISAKELLDETYKRIEQVEQKTKLPILGSVQEYTRGGKK